MTFELHRHDARHVSTLLAPESVDLIVTSPPYFALRSYRDECEACGGDGVARPGTTAGAPPSMGGYGTGNLGDDRMRSSTLTGGKRKLLDLHKSGDAPSADATCPACNGTGRAHYDGQLGSEATPTEFVDNLIACTADWLRVLKPTGSLWVNLGDKYAGSNGQSGGPSQLSGATYSPNGSRTKDAKKGGYTPVADGIRAKSLMGLPWRYALRCIDELGLILRAEVIWSKPNGLPESVTDRVRRSHEQFFHFTREGRYFAAIDEVREPQDDWRTGRDSVGKKWVGATDGPHGYATPERDYNPLGKVPGSVWTVPSEPLVVPDHLGVDHFAAYPSELVRRIVLGWSPSGYCCECGEPRRAVVASEYRTIWKPAQDRRADHIGHQNGNGAPYGNAARNVTITGYACACTPCDFAAHPIDEPCSLPPTRPAVVLDPFAGTGTTPAVAHHLGRHGIGVDLSADYLRLAEWRCTRDRMLRDKCFARSGLPAAPPTEGQLNLFAELHSPEPFRRQP